MGTVTNLCTIISGAPDNDLQYLKENINSESYIICADSGYKSCINAGFTPNLIIGDFDSAPKPNIDCEIITLNPEKAYLVWYNGILYRHSSDYIISENNIEVRRTELK